MDPVVGKCGTRMAWHWAHLSSPDPDRHDPWSEPEGEWHRKWKSYFAGRDPEKMEVRITDPTGVYHIADVLKDGWVIELQHSPISKSDIVKREDFYTAHAEGMLWVSDRRSLSSHVRERILTFSYFKRTSQSIAPPDLVTYSHEEAKQCFSFLQFEELFQKGGVAELDKSLKPFLEKARAAARLAEEERRSAEAAEKFRAISSETFTRPSPPQGTLRQLGR